MPQLDPTETTNIDGYGADVIPWRKVRDLLVSDLPRPETAAFLGTVSPDGHPHAAGIGPLYHDGALYFTTGPHARKTRDPLANPTCTLAMRVTGMDLTFDSTATRETNSLVLEAVVGKYRDGGWPAEVDAGGDALTGPYSAQTAGPPPWSLYRFTIAQIVGLNLSASGGATRWRFTTPSEFS